MKGALLVAAGLFVVVAGANDGSSVLAAGTRVSGMRPLISLVLLLSTLVVGPPLLFGTGVATTLAHRLVPFGATGSRCARRPRRRRPETGALEARKASVA